MYPTSRRVSTFKYLVTLPFEERVPVRKVWRSVVQVGSGGHLPCIPPSITITYPSRPFAVRNATWPPAIRPLQRFIQSTYNSDHKQWPKSAPGLGNIRKEKSRLKEFERLSCLPTPALAFALLDQPTVNLSSVCGHFVNVVSDDIGRRTMLGGTLKGWHQLAKR